uniref:Uncharacterized protein n=1 Tax=Candidatus Kentrum sp. LPFa TaxID=2126335 RepID=A0A450VVH9_9GAMM|nr:MAG: hypothetical protein BECKLPF1236B_GA0070989_100429 [Candidatus Kentron sp. LPFa]
MNKETPPVAKETATSLAGAPQQQAQRQPQTESELAGNPALQSQLARAIGQAQFLIAYVAREGRVFDPALLDTLIRSKQLFGSEQFTTEAEVAFWLAYNELVKELRPISVESLEESLPPPVDSTKRWLRSRRQPPSAASRMVRRYRLLSAFSLVLILVAQVYWLIGSGVSQELEKIFTQREGADVELTQYRYEKELRSIEQVSGAQPTTDGDPTLIRLQKEYRFSNQLLDSHYGLLQKWNNIWGAMLFMEPFRGKNTEYNTLKFEAGQRRLRERLDRIEQRGARGGEMNAGADTAVRDELVMQLEEEHLAFEHDKARHRFFLNRISAGFALTALQVYLLPLLYGLLGAATYILRQLSIVTREMTFTRNAGIHFRLRISLGALAGMSIGWFLSPEDAATLALSPFALAFLVGYNVELLFLLMDKFIQSVAKIIESKLDENKATPPPSEKKPASKPAPEPAPVAAQTKASREVMAPTKPKAMPNRPSSEIELPISLSKTRHGELC